MKSFLKRIRPSAFWSFLKRCKRVLFLGFRGSLDILGYNIDLKKNLYSPLPIASQLKSNVERWNKPSRLTGIEYDIEEFKETLLNLLSKYYDEFLQCPDYFEILNKGFGPGFPALDALILYMTIRDRKPRRYFEVGSGLSTYYCSLAAGENEKEGFPLQIKCIEPYPYKKLLSLSRIEVDAKEVQDVDVKFFQELEENDILFIDSSHILKIDGDVPFLYLEVLPNLNRGVLVHIHDIPLPFNIPYPPEYWILEQDWPRYWNEAMVLQAFLCFNNKFKLTMSAPLLRYYDESFLQRNINIYDSIKQKQKPITFSSIWIQKGS